MLGNWLKKRRADGRARSFWAQLEKSGIPAALQFYETVMLATDKSEIPVEISAAFHLLSWMTDYGEIHFRALRSLAAGGSASGVVAAVWRQVQQMQFQLNVASALTALRNRPVALPAPVTDGEIADWGPPLSGHALLDSLAAQQSSDMAGPRRKAESLLRQISAIPSSIPGAEARRYVQTWSCMISGNYAWIIADRKAQATSADASARAVFLGAVHALVTAELRRGDVKVALNALRNAEAVASPAEWRALVVPCGLMLLTEEPATAESWFTENLRVDHAADSELRAVLTLCLAAAQIRSGLFAHANRVLDAGITVAKEDVRAQLVYLAALCLLAPIKDWIDPQRTGDEDLRQNLRVKNRSLWMGSREALEPRVRELGAGGSALTWRGHLLLGLIAWADSGVNMDAESLDKFSAAIDHVESATARTRLKVIEGTLVTRARASEQATEMIQRGRHEQLRQLHETILAEMGDAIPPLLRATVCMTLWAGNPSGYDPLPELKRVPRQPAGEDLIGQCIAHVELMQGVENLRRRCMGGGLSTEALPLHEPFFAYDAGVGERTALAIAAIHLRHGDFLSAKRLLDLTGNTDPEDAAWARFYVAWKQGDADACRELGESAHGTRIRRDSLWSQAVTMLDLRQALQQDDEQRAGSMLDRLASSNGGVARVIALLLLWLLRERQPRLGSVLLRIAAARTREAGPQNPVSSHLERVCTLMAPAVYAQSGQYAACVEAVDRLLPQALTDSAFDPALDVEIVAWCRLLKVAAQLALIAGAEGDIKAQWRSWQRAWNEQQPALMANPATEPYAYLLGGLGIYLSSDALVHEQTIVFLSKAEQRLSLSRHAGFLQGVIGKLTWRRNVLDSFWRSLAKGELKQARAIYYDELLPSFGARIPYPIQLGMVIVDWDAGTASTPVLLERLELLHHEAPELSLEVIAKTRDYVQEGETLRQLAGLLRQQEFEPLINRIDRLSWVGLSPGAMPLVVAIARIYACMKVRRTEEATEMGTHITQAGKFDRWMVEQAEFLTGYALFGDQKYPDAAASFARIGNPMLLGHEVAKYLAAARFNHGLQLLKVNQEDKAFEAFRQSLDQAAGSQSSGQLAPLCAHFALKALDARNGEQARASFVLMGRSLAMRPDSAEKQFSTTIASMGVLLCRALMDEDVSNLNGEQFYRLAPSDVADSAEANVRSVHELQRAVRLLGVCQELKRQRRLPEGRRDSRRALADSLRSQIPLLETLQEKLKRVDPVLLVLRGTVDVRLSGDRMAEGLHLLEQAMRLGVHSARLAALMERFRESARKTAGANNAALDLFDIYLSSGGVPLAVRKHLVRNDSVIHLYRLGRNCHPADIVTDEFESGTTLMCERVERLIRFIRSDSFDADAETERICTEVEQLTAQLRTSEEQLNIREQRILEQLARILKQQNPDEDPPEHGRKAAKHGE